MDLDYDEQEIHAIISELPVFGFTPCYIVCLTSSTGRLYAVGIETAEQVWKRCEAYVKFGSSSFNYDAAPIIIAPAWIPNPMQEWTATEFDWNIPLLKGI